MRLLVQQSVDGREQLFLRCHSLHLHIRTRYCLTKNLSHSLTFPCPFQPQRGERGEFVDGELRAAAFAVAEEHSESDFCPVLQLLCVASGDGHGALPRLVLRQGRNTPFEGSRGALGGLGGRFLLRWERYDTKLLQAFALPVHQRSPHRRGALFCGPSSDVHAVDGDAGQDIGLTLFVAYEFA